MTELANDTPQETEVSSDAPALFRHKKRPEWGLAMIAWEHDTKRGYQFEDGELRIFGEDFYPLLEEVDRPADRAAATISTLERLMGVSQERKDGPSDDALIPQRPTFEDQLAIFRAEFEAGFDDEKWLEDVRGTGAKRRLKRHRDAALEEAQSILGAKELKALHKAENYEEITERALKVLDGTDLVTGAEVKLLKKMQPPRRRSFGKAVFELLHGDGAFDLRFERFVAELNTALPKKKQPSWQLATTLPALMYPETHICVRPTSFRDQARWMAPRLVFTRAPNAPTYARLLDMANAVKTELAASGDPAKDMSDVHDFIRLSLRPSAVKEYIEKTPEKSLNATKATTSEAA